MDNAFELVLRWLKQFRTKLMFVTINSQHKQDEITY